MNEEDIKFYKEIVKSNGLYKKLVDNNYEMPTEIYMQGWEYNTLLLLRQEHLQKMQ